MSKERKYRSFDSSNIDGAHYDEGAKMLYVRFKGGNEYAYSDVPEETWTGMKEAESAGQYFQRNIRGGDFKFTIAKSGKKDG